MTTHKIASQNEWLAARRTLLAREKALTRARDELSAARRELPWVRLEKGYVFDGPRGRETLGDLFEGHINTTALGHSGIGHPDFRSASLHGPSHRLG